MALITLGAACALMLATACGGDDSPAPTATSSPEPVTPAPAATATADPLDAEASGTRALEHVRQLAEIIGPRVAGTEGERRARDYIRAELERLGFAVSIQEFPYDASSFVPARMTAGDLSEGAYVFRNSPARDVSGTLVAAGIGKPEEFPVGGMNGAIALVERGDLTFSEKAKNAAAAGASALLLYNNEPGQLLGDANDATIPVIGITRAAGQALLERLPAAPVTAEIVVTPPIGTSANVVAKPPGVTQCTTVTGGHYDSVPVAPGADDNASGTAAVLEVARIARARGLAGANCFVLFGAEEVGLFGSRAFVEGLSDADLGALNAMLNIDVVGLEAELHLIGSDDMVEQARLAGNAAGVVARRAELEGRAGSDHLSFEDADVPVVMFNRADDEIHTSNDVVSRISAERLAEAVRIAYGTLEALSER